MSEDDMMMSVGIARDTLAPEEQMLAENLVVGFLSSCSDMDDDRARFMARGALVALACFIRPADIAKMLPGGPDALDVVIHLGTRQAEDIIEANEVSSRIESLIVGWDDDDMARLMEGVPRHQKKFSRTHLMREVEAAVLQRMQSL